MLTYTDFDNLMLNRADLKILKSIKKAGKLQVENKEVCRRLSSAKLARGEYIGMAGDFPVHGNNLSLTDNGKMYFVFRKQRVIKFLYRSILVPIFVALVTTLITIWLKSLLQ